MGPLGFLIPFTLNGKLLMHDTFKKDENGKIDWNEEVKDEEKTEVD